MMFMPTCKEMAERSTRGEFENASWITRLFVAMHMGMCVNCRLFARQMKQIAQAVREKADRAVDPAKLAEFEKRLIRRLVP